MTILKILKANLSIFKSLTLVFLLAIIINIKTIKTIDNLLICFLNLR